MSNKIPDAWDDDWVNVADSQEAKAPQPAPKLSKSERRQQHNEFQKQLWNSAENPSRNHFLESRGVVPLKQEYKPQVTLLSRKPPPVIAKKDAADGMNGLTLDDGDDSEDEARRKRDADFEERQRKAKVEREEKQRKYAEARERIMGSSVPGTPAVGSRESSQGRNDNRRRGRGGGGPKTSRPTSADQSPKAPGSPAFGPTASTGPGQLYDPEDMGRRISKPSTPNQDGPSQPVFEQELCNSSRLSTQRLTRRSEAMLEAYEDSPGTLKTSLVSGRVWDNRETCAFEILTSLLYNMISPRFIAGISALAACSSARDITFPPAYGVQAPFGSAVEHDDFGELDVFGGSSGLMSYANLPYVQCLAPDGQNVEKYDIAIVGAPFDTGVTARPGARFGPNGIRAGSRRIAPESAWSMYTGRNSFLEWAKIVDCGDAPLTFLDNTVALKQLTKTHKVISSREANNTEYPAPRIITLGGDHTTTLPALRSTYDHFGAVSVIHFDSHIDTWDPDVLGGGISHYAGVNHGTFLHIAHEEGLVLNSSIHAGIRAPLANKKYDLKHDKACGFNIITARELDRIGTQGVIDKLKERTDGTKVYISVDIDVLDPAYAPATGTAEVGGWTTRELLTILDGLSGMEVVGGDVVEVSPIYDNRGETTQLAAAEVVHSLIDLMVETPVKGKL
ncbi:hypothetical protein D0860_06527 [Hortaea werneckii]|uniref:SUZ domain-containing protein n=1 Tax=Hortaea werneckii TaxID=91943 RepID=A0A3M7GSW5_HORWE|nr:hypothetical protein D0860_06527 [Hortaea werneckii]